MARHKCYIGIDLGGTTVKIGALSIEEVLLHQWEIPTRTQDGGQHILPDIIESVSAYLRESDQEVVAIGVGIPGVVDNEGNVVRAVNIHWENVAVGKILQEALGCPVAVANDANIAALGETYKGSARGYQNAVLFTLGTGVGGGIIVDGKIVTGSHGAGGEVGHLPVSEHKLGDCNCGGTSCLELVASATGIVRLAKKHLEDKPQSSLLGYEVITSKAIFDEVAKEDKVAMAIVDEYARYLGRGLAILAAVTDPEVFILGGGVSKAGDRLLEPVRTYYKEQTFPSCKDIPIVLAKLGNDAGTWGAFKLAIDLKG